MLGLFDVSLPPLLSEPSLRVCTGHQTLHLAASSHRAKRLGHSYNLSHLHLHGHSMLFMLDLTFAMVRILLAHDDTKLTVEPRHVVSSRSQCFRRYTSGLLTLHA